MKELLFLEPIVKELIWGKECWSVCAHPNGDGIVTDGVYAGKKLSWLWENKRELFGNLEGDKFPLLVKKITAKDDLSIQVHPDNAYAKINENGSLGKTECWYVTDCKPGGTVIIGHHAASREEAEELIQNHEWKKFLREIPIKAGDFFQIEPGIIHAIKRDTEIIEIQQSSDITYRLYDYDRLKDGKPRELHIKKSMDVMQIPYKEAEKHKSKPEGCLVSCDYYTVNKREIAGEADFIQDKAFQIVSVIKGTGMADGKKIEKDDSFIVPFGYGTYKLSGNMNVLISNP